MPATVTDPIAATSAALARSLDALADLLEQTADEAYAARPPGGVSGPVGAHVRHVLDHVGVFFERPKGPTLTYDRRERNTSIERSRREGIDALRFASIRLRAAPNPAVDPALVLEALVEHGEPAVEVASSLGRELLFALQHTIHHQAIIAVLLLEHGVATQSRFGYAPATPTR